jgi:hypothetical protein
MSRLFIGYSIKAVSMILDYFHIEPFVGNQPWQDWVHQLEGGCKDADPLSGGATSLKSILWVLFLMAFVLFDLLDRMQGVKGLWSTHVSVQSPIVPSPMPSIPVSQREISLIRTDQSVANSILYERQQIITLRLQQTFQSYDAFVSHQGLYRDTSYLHPWTSATVNGAQVPVTLFGWDAPTRYALNGLGQVYLTTLPLNFWGVGSSGDIRYIPQTIFLQSDRGDLPVIYVNENLEAIFVVEGTPEAVLRFLSIA